MSKPILKQPKVFIEIDDEEQEVWNNELNSLSRSVAIEREDLDMLGAIGWLLVNFDDVSKNGAKQIYYNWTRTFESSGDGS